jgi:alkylhydroperoxidase family enzyme
VAERLRFAGFRLILIRPLEEVPMARIAPASADVYGPLFGEDAPLRVQIYAQRPEIATAFLAFGRALREERLLPDRLIELVRLRVAFWNQCRSCMAVRYEEGIEDGLTEGLVCSLERPEDAEDLTEAERTAIAYADLAATNHHAISDETFDRLREVFTEPEIMELLFNVGLFVGFGRMGNALHMVDDLPERYQTDAEVTPWGAEESETLLIGNWASTT